MAQKPLTLSIIIPAYNEEHHIAACLNAIAAQIVRQDEVILIDNNCTDKTVEIAKRYPFVTVIQERKQGRGYARTTGFNAAQGDIIGRIDADSIMDADWVERVKEDFQDPRISAVTGLGNTYTLLLRAPFLQLHSSLWSRVYLWNAHFYFNAAVLWGANMAIRRTAWGEVKADICLDDAIVHEDTDLGLLLTGHGLIIVKDNYLRITTNGQSYHYWPKLYEYLKRTRNTRLHHQKLGTFSRATFLPYNKWRAAPGWIVSLPLNALFVVSSLLLWPIDELAFRLGQDPKTWLD